MLDLQLSIVQEQSQILNCSVIIWRYLFFLAKVQICLTRDRRWMQRAAPSRILASAILQAVATKHFRVGSKTQRGQHRPSPGASTWPLRGSSSLPHPNICSLKPLWLSWVFPRYTGACRAEGSLWGGAGAAPGRHPYWWIRVHAGNPSTLRKSIVLILSLFHANLF